MKMNENMEAMMEKKAARAMENTEAMTKEQKLAMTKKKINEYMEIAKTAPFNPYHNFTLQCVIAKLAPQFYTQEELAQIKKLYQCVLQETVEGDVVQETMEGDHVHQETMDGDVVQETMERDVVQETMEGDHVRQETMERDVVQETMEEDVGNKKKRCRSSDEGSSMSVERRVKPKTTKKIKPKKLSSPPPILPIHFENKIKELNGTDIKYIMCKKLSASDLKDDQNRLLMPHKEIKVEFLINTEKDKSSKPVGLEVIVLDPSFREFTMSLRKWSMGINKYYSLVRGWKTVFSNNSFKEGKKLNIWTFRVNGKVHFVLDNNQVML